MASRRIIRTAAWGGAALVSGLVCWWIWQAAPNFAGPAFGLFTVTAVMLCNALLPPRATPKRAADGQRDHVEDRGSAIRTGPRV